MKKVNIVMFHYIRPIAGSQYPNIKGLELASFKNQLDYFQKKFGFLTPEEFKHNFENKIKSNRVNFT